jgi:hypothetical protein
MISSPTTEAADFPAERRDWHGMEQKEGRDRSLKYEV